MSENEPQSRKPLILTLITAGIFLIGAALIPLLVRGQQAALDSTGIILPPGEMNQAAPQLELTDLQGNPVSLADERGKLVLVNNWATWCPPCKTEMPELQAYYQAHRSQGFEIIAIESGEPASTVSAFVRQFGVTFQVWLDPHSAALDAFRNWDLPSSYVVDRQGTLRMSWTGPLTRAALEKYLTPLLEK